MQKFYQSLDEIEQTVSSLNSHYLLKCQHCSEQGHFVSHGFIYKQYSSCQKKAVGKRIICSNRYGHTGCGRTYQLMLAEQLPSRRYGASQLLMFILLLLSHLSVCSAYQQATGQESTRHAWRWLKRLKDNLMNYRGVLQKPSEQATSLFTRTRRRTHLIFFTLAQLFSANEFTSCAQFQYQQQSAFL